KATRIEAAAVRMHFAAAHPASVRVDFSAAHPSTKITAVEPAATAISAGAKSSATHAAPTESPVSAAEAAARGAPRWHGDANSKDAEDQYVTFHLVLVSPICLNVRLRSMRDYFLAATRSITNSLIAGSGISPRKRRVDCH